MNIEKIKSKISTPLVICSILLLSFTSWIFLYPNHSLASISSASVWVRTYFGSIYLYFGLFCVVFLILICFLPIGQQRLGGRKKPEYGFFPWLAMLYSAGMGSGILLRAVQEPVFMYQNLTIGPEKPRDVMALEFTFYQWGLTAWAFYLIFSLIFAKFIFKKNRPVQLLSLWKNHNMLKALPDYFILIATVFGIVSTLALGATQLNAGLAFLHHDWKENLETSWLIIFILTAISLWSSWRGLKKGIQLWSILNILMTTLLFLFILYHSDLMAIQTLFFHSLTEYFKDFIPLSLALHPYNPGEDFLSDWTYYYWAFWIAWAPFIGIFIARISLGRKIRTLIIAVLLIPSLTTFLWFTVFGQNGIVILNQLGSPQDQFSNVYHSIFIFFNHFSWAQLTPYIVLFVLAGFLITSVDSSIYVLAMISDHGNTQPSRIHRLVWGIVLLFMGCALLLLGNLQPQIDVLNTIQKILILSSLPLLFLMIFLIIRYLR